MTNINRSWYLNCLPCALAISEELTNSTMFIEEQARFHKCRKKIFINLKLDRAGKRVNIDIDIEISNNIIDTTMTSETEITESTEESAAELRKQAIGSSLRFSVNDEVNY